MQATLFWACAVAPKRLRRFAHAQNDLIWTAADATELDLAAAPNQRKKTIVKRSGKISVDGAVMVVAWGFCYGWCRCARGGARMRVRGT